MAEFSSRVTLSLGASVFTVLDEKAECIPDDATWDSAGTDPLINTWRCRKRGSLPTAHPHKTKRFAQKIHGVFGGGQTLHLYPKFFRSVAHRSRRRIQSKTEKGPRRPTCVTVDELPPLTDVGGLDHLRCAEGTAKPGDQRLLLPELVAGGSVAAPPTPIDGARSWSGLHTTVNRLSAHECE